MIRSCLAAGSGGTEHRAEAGPTSSGPFRKVVNQSNARGRLWVHMVESWTFHEGGISRITASDTASNLLRRTTITDAQPHAKALDILDDRVAYEAKRRVLAGHMAALNQVCNGNWGDHSGSSSNASCGDNHTPSPLLSRRGCPADDIIVTVVIRLDTTYS